MKKIISKLEQLENDALKKFNFSSSLADGDYEVFFFQKKGFKINKRCEFCEFYEITLSDLYKYRIETVIEISDLLIKFYGHLKEQSDKKDYLDLRLLLLVKDI